MFGYDILFIFCLLYGGVQRSVLYTPKTRKYNV